MTDTKQQQKKEVKCRHTNQHIQQQVADRKKASVARERGQERVKGRAREQETESRRSLIAALVSLLPAPALMPHSGEGGHWKDCICVLALVWRRNGSDRSFCCWPPVVAGSNALPPPLPNAMEDDSPRIPRPRPMPSIMPPEDSPRRPNPRPLPSMSMFWPEADSCR